MTGSEQDTNPAGRNAVPSIPLSAEAATSAEDKSVGTLVRDVTTQVSTLIRAEVELAKAEITGEVKKGVKGGIFFVIALTVLLFSLFFLFFTIAEAIQDIFGLYRSASFGIVFLLMVLVAGLFAFLGYRKVTKIKAPERTITSAKDTVSALKNRGGEPDQITG